MQPRIIYFNTDPKISFLLQLVLVFGLFSIVACKSPSTFEENISIEEGTWYYKDTLSFEANIEDTEALYNVFINVRHSNEYPNANLWLKVVTTFPDGKTQVAPLNVPMADPEGKWFGTGFGSILSNQIQIQRKAIFDQKGIYKFQVLQDMRVNPMKEIIDVGIQIDKNEDPK